MATEENNNKNTPNNSKKSPKVPIVNNHAVENMQITDPIIAKLIKDSILIRFAQIDKQKRKHDIDELSAMYSTCQEFMQSFVILGYDLSGRAIAPMVHAHNQQEADALGTYINKFLHSNIREIDLSGEP